MLIFPAIDLKDGQCVRLYQGDMKAVTVYSENPVEMALQWQEAGAEFLHLVDLDGAVAGSPKNLPVIKDIVKELQIPVQLGGGIRNIETIASYIELGITRVIIGTAAIKNPQLIQEGIDKFGSEAIVLGLDSTLGNVAVDGWEKVVEKSSLEFALEMKEMGISRIIYTDTLKDGTLEGINVDSTKEMAEKTGLKIIASGGVAGIKDVLAVKELETVGVEGLIIGKALYNGNLDLKEALEIAKGDK